MEGGLLIPRKAPAGLEDGFRTSEKWSSRLAGQLFVPQNPSSTLEGVFSAPKNPSAGRGDYLRGSLGTSARLTDIIGGVLWGATRQADADGAASRPTAILCPVHHPMGRIPMLLHEPQDELPVELHRPLHLGQIHEFHCGVGLVDTAGADH